MTTRFTRWSSLVVSGALSASALGACGGSADPWRGESTRTTADPRRPEATTREPAQKFLHCHGDTCEIELGATAREVVIARPCTSSVCPANRGVLTVQGLQQADEIASLLSGAEIAASYGCPRCADGWLFDLRLWQSATTVRRVGYDPDESENLPDALVQVTELVRSVRSALLSCTPNDLVEIADPCEPTR